MTGLRIEDYALVGDTQTTALIGIDGSIDWFCAPRFDSGACFAALLGDAENGRWLIGPANGDHATRRSYRPGTLVLESEFETEDGTVRITDFMPVRDRTVDIIRIVTGVRGAVPMRMDLVIRFDYGSIVPWVRDHRGSLRAVAGPDALALHTPVAHEGADLHTVAEFTVTAGQSIPFALSWYPSHHEHPPAPDAEAALRATTAWWEEWSDRCSYDGEYRHHVHRSLITLKALTYAPTGGIVAAPTTSLPEWPGSVRNWDYRYCWLRDATLTLNALMRSGYLDEAKAWREWLLRAVAGDPSELQIMYGVAGERRLTEFELSWLPGYEQSAPVRTGNAASEQFQLDVYGEIAYSMYEGRRWGVGGDGAAWPLYRSVVQFLEEAWKRPDEGIWEVRGPRQHFTHSKVMAWVAFDRSVRALEEYGKDLGIEPGAAERFAACRDAVHAEVCERAWNADRGAFMQAYGSDHLDAAVLQMPMVGFLPPDDPRVVSTVEAIERELTVDGLVLRYDTGGTDDGLPPGEGVFLPCSFWLVDALALIGRVDDARRLFERLIGLANDVGLIAEEYDPAAGRQLGNFPQAFTHLALVNAAWVLSFVGEAKPS